MRAWHAVQEVLVVVGLIAISLLAVGILVLGMATPWVTLINKLF